MMKKVIALLFVFSLVFGVAACAPKNYSTKLSVDTAEFAFTPAEYTVAAGQEVTLTITNSGTVEHEFVIMNFGTAVSIPFGDDDEGNIYWETEVMPGEGKTVTFTVPSDIGEYQIICGTAGHVENGMLGKMTVVAP